MRRHRLPTGDATCVRRKVDLTRLHLPYSHWTRRQRCKQEKCPHRATGAGNGEKGRAWSAQHRAIFEDRPEFVSSTEGEGIPSAGLAGAEGRVRRGHGRSWKWSHISKECETSRKRQTCHEGVISNAHHSSWKFRCNARPCPCSLPCKV